MKALNLVLAISATLFAAQSLATHSEEKPGTNLNKVLKKLFVEFWGCHIKYYFENFVEQNDYLESKLNVIHQFENTITFSMEYFNHLIVRNKLGSIKVHNPKKFTPCVIHWYIFHQKSLAKTFIIKISNIMQMSELSDGTPSYYILSENPVYTKPILNKYKRLKTFLTNEIISVYIKGPVLYIDSFETIYRVYIPGKEQSACTVWRWKWQYCKCLE